MLHIYVGAAFVEGKCAIGRFYGQTHFYIPSDIVQRIGAENIQEVAKEVFGEKQLKDFGWTQFRTHEYYFLELPGVLPRRENDLADTLAERIMELNQK
ncbi:MAG: hypothetical protein AABW53_02940 [Nanoarchaeota archaeon]